MRLTHEQFRELAAKHGLAVTHQRQVVYEAVIASHGHYSPEDIYAAVRRLIPSISLATVYNNLRLFIECGLLREVTPHAPTLRVDGNLEPHHHLVCSRCATNWIFSRMMCAGCGESDGTKLPIYQEQEQFPHARVDGCQTCRKYLLTFDLRRETRAVPIVDEIAGLPLDLYARDQGLTKITPNLMGN